jgi:hypothetical protein
MIAGNGKSYSRSVRSSAVPEPVLCKRPSADDKPAVIILDGSATISLAEAEDSSIKISSLFSQNPFTRSISIAVRPVLAFRIDDQFLVRQIHLP